MITDALIGVWGSFIGWLGGVVTFPAPPEFISTLAGYITQASSYVVDTGVWIPWALLTSVIAAWVACLLAAVGVKLVRVVLSFFTAGGGSAA